MSSKARLCNGCGRWAESGLWVDDDGGRWWTCGDSRCITGATVVYPQPPPPEVR